MEKDKTGPSPTQIKSIDWAIKTLEDVKTNADDVSALLNLFKQTHDFECLRRAILISEIGTMGYVYHEVFCALYNTKENDNVQE